MKMMMFRRLSKNCFSALLLAAAILIPLSLVPLSLVPLSSATADGVFTIRGVPVDATADSAAAAREIALLEGQEAALQRLFRRLTMRNDRNNLPRVDPLHLPGLVRSFELSGEKTSTTRYLATMTVRFYEEPVRALLEGRGIDFSEVQARPRLLLPIRETLAGVSLWEDNPWRDAWAAADMSGSLTPYVLPIGDLEDWSGVSIDQAMRGDWPALQDLARRYGADEVVVARASDAGVGANTGGGLRLNAIIHDGGTPFVGETLIAPAGDLAAGVEQIIAASEEAWKRQTIIRDNSEGILRVKVSHGSLSEWNTIHNHLTESPLIREVVVDSITAFSARLRIEHDGAVALLASALEQNDLMLAPGSGGWTLRLVR